VTRTTTFVFDSDLLNRDKAVARPEPIAVLELAKEEGLVGGGGRLGDRATGEDDEADPVSGALLDEVRDHRFRDGQPVVGLKVLGGHGAGHIEGHHDVDTLGGELIAAEALLGAGQCNHDEGEGEGGKPKGQRPEPGPQAPRKAPDGGGPGQAE
jgi:hypothetical protein